MTRVTALLSAALCAVSLHAHAQEIRSDEVGRILRTLAADSMEGRGTLSRGSEMAQAFITKEFAEIGLKPLPGASDYRQPFPIVRMTPGKREVTLNGVPMASDRIFAISEADSLVADERSGLTVVRIAADDNLRGRIAELSRGAADALVLVDPSHEKVFKRYRGFLAGPSYRPKRTGSPTIVAVLADSAALERFHVHVVNRVETRELANLVGTIPGRRAGEMVVFAGHYDHLGIVAPVDGDSIANGADDDASGTTAVLTLARYYAARGVAPERTLVFTAFAAEEVGGYGSAHFAETLPADSIVAMCNIEMIGQASLWGENSAWITGYDITTFGAILAEAAKGKGFAFHPDPYTAENLFYRSDNASLARKGVPAHTVSATQIDKDRYYHSVDDEVETLDVNNMTRVIRGIAAGMAPIVAGEKTPTRVPPGSLK